MRKTIIFIHILLMLLIPTIPLCSIGIDYNTNSIGTLSEFGGGIFPLQLNYSFDFPMFQMTKQNLTRFALLSQNGLLYRELQQDPNTGNPISLNPDQYDFPRTYMTFYSELDLLLQQGFFKYNNLPNDILNISLSFDLRFEKAYEPLLFLYDEQHREGLFHKESELNNLPELRFPDSKWIGQPELANSRNSTQASITTGLSVNLMYDSITIKNGLKFNLLSRIAPQSIQFMGSNNPDFFSVYANLDFAYTPIAIKQNSNNSLTCFSLMLYNRTTYRYITGSKIPYYIQGGNILGAKSINTNHIISNRTSLNFFGPQIYKKDCYPVFSSFFDVALSFGTLLNSINEQTYIDYICSIGLKAEFVIFNISELFFEYGYVIKNTLNLSPYSIFNFGFKIGV